MLRPKLFLAAMAALALSGWCASSASAALIAYWEFEPGASFANDSSGNLHHLTNSGAGQDTTNYAPGGSTGSASFDGVDDFLKTTSTLDLSGYSAITISWWQRITSNVIGVVFEHSVNSNDSSFHFG